MRCIKLFILLCALIFTSGCSISIPNKPKTADTQWIKTNLTRLYGSDFDVNLLSGQDGKACSFYAYDKKYDFNFTVKSYIRQVKPFSKFGVDIVNDIRIPQK